MLKHVSVRVNRFLFARSLSNRTDRLWYACALFSYSSRYPAWSLLPFRNAGRHHRIKENNERNDTLDSAAREVKEVVKLVPISPISEFCETIFNENKVRYKVTDFTSVIIIH